MAGGAYTQQNNADLFAPRGIRPGLQANADGQGLRPLKYARVLWEDVFLPDHTPYQLGARFNVDKCVSITVQVSFLFNSCVMTMRNQGVGPTTAASVLTNPRGMELTNGDTVIIEANRDIQTEDFVYLIAKDFWINCVLSAAAAGGYAHISYGVV
jgi:hypothetical protein